VWIAWPDPVAAAQPTRDPAVRPVQWAPVHPRSPPSARPSAHQIYPPGVTRRGARPRGKAALPRRIKGAPGPGRSPPPPPSPSPATACRLPPSPRGFALAESPFPSSPPCSRSRSCAGLLIPSAVLREGERDDPWGRGRPPIRSALGWVTESNPRSSPLLSLSISRRGVPPAPLLPVPRRLRNACLASVAGTMYGRMALRVRHNRTS